MSKFLKRQKGFSLIELLIVIAILGVLAVISFSMFSGVLTNSKKRADDQQAKNIEKAVISFMVASGNSELKHLSYDTVTDQDMHNQPSTTLIYALQHSIEYPTESDMKESGPFLTPKAGASPSASHFAPQWNASNSGEYVGYKIDVFSKDFNCNVEPTTDPNEAKVIVH